MKNLLTAALCAVIVCGCTALNPWEVSQQNVENSKQLRVGMTKAQVLAIMGEPVRNESFNRPDLWFYYFETNWLDGLITEDECFPLVFKDGKLLGWGNSFYSRFRLELNRQTSDIDTIIKANEDTSAEVPEPQEKKTETGK